MGSYKRPLVFHPLDLQVIDLVYAAAWAQFEARDPYRDRSHDEERRKLLRQQVFALAKPGDIEFDALLDKVLASIPETWTMAVSAPPLPEVCAGVSDAGDANKVAE